MTTRYARIPDLLRLCLLLGFCIAASASGPALLAQQIPEPERKYSRFTDPDVKKGEETVTLETEITTRLEMPGIEIKPCQAQVELAYYQRNDIARVNATVTHKQCQAVAGSFEVLVSVRSGEDDLTRYTYPETFVLDGENATTFTRDYPIGSNVTLSSVRSRNVKCECTEIAGD